MVGQSFLQIRDKEMETLKLSLSETNNSEFYDLINRSNILTVSRNEINKRLLAIDTKMWNSRRAKREMSSVQPDVEKFVEAALKWKHEASNFILKPHFIFPESDNLQLRFQHFIDNLRDAIFRIESSINLLETNYNNTGFFIDSHLNFRIAIGSFLIAFIGLIVALIPLFACSK